MPPPKWAARLPVRRLVVLMLQCLLPSEKKRDQTVDARKHLPASAGTKCCRQTQRLRLQLRRRTQMPI